MLRTMSSLSVPTFDSVPSPMPKLWPINHFPQVNPLVPGLKLLEKRETYSFAVRIREAVCVQVTQN